MQEIKKFRPMGKKALESCKRSSLSNSGRSSEQYANRNADSDGLTYQASEKTKGYENWARVHSIIVRKYICSLPLSW